MIASSPVAIWTDPTTNRSWGFHQPTVGRMHVIPLDSDRDVGRRVHLEGTGGERVFQPDVGFRRTTLESLGAFVEHHRLELERRWLASLALDGRLLVQLSRDGVLLTVYAGEPLERTRSIAIPSTGRPIVHVEGAVLVVEREPDERPLRIDLAAVLFSGPERRRAWSASSARPSI